MSDAAPPSPSAPRAIAAALSGGAAPTLLASGYGTVAEEILRLAFERGIPVREDADLAQILAALDLGDAIPLEALEVVSEILRHVYLANGQIAPLVP